jgi:hypothetical protein
MNLHADSLIENKRDTPWQVNGGRGTRFLSKRSSSSPQTFGRWRLKKRHLSEFFWRLRIFPNGSSGFSMQRILYRVNLQSMP